MSRRITRAQRAKMEAEAGIGLAPDPYDWYFKGKKTDKEARRRWKEKNGEMDR